VRLIMPKASHAWLLAAIATLAALEDEFNLSAR
jgi:hypothetical protein